MQKLMILSLLSFIPLAHAEQQSFEEVKEGARVITYTVRVYRDEIYDHEQWEKIVSDVAKMAEKGDSAQSDDMITAFVRGIETIASRDNKAEDGIHGDMTIEISDGKKDITRCGNNCPCVDKDFCPCTDDANCKMQ